MIEAVFMDALSLDVLGVRLLGIVLDLRGVGFQRLNVSPALCSSRHTRFWRHFGSPLVLYCCSQSMTPIVGLLGLVVWYNGPVGMV